MDIKNTVVVFITDKSGCEMFKEYIHKDYVDSAKINLPICWLSNNEMLHLYSL